MRGGFLSKVSMCVTGHRPNKLMGGYDYYANEPIKDYMITTLRNFIELNPSVTELECYSGMALGIDMLFADAVLTLQQEFPDLIKLHCAIPFENQTGNWVSESDIEMYNLIKDFADEVTTLEGIVTKDFYLPLQKRNEFMVDNSDFVLAFWNGTKGGTGNCVKYAEKKGKKVVVKTFGLKE